jgi:hypothetical protein
LKAVNSTQFLGFGKDLEIQKTTDDPRLSKSNFTKSVIIRKIFQKHLVLTINPTAILSKKEKDI